MKPHADCRSLHEAMKKHNNVLKEYSNRSFGTAKADSLQNEFYSDM